jgi:hypothetical protein
MLIFFRLSRKEQLRYSYIYTFPFCILGKKNKKKKKGPVSCFKGKKIVQRQKIGVGR